MAPPEGFEDWADVIQLRAPPPEADCGSGWLGPARSRGRRALRLFLLLVVLPTCLTGLYDGVLAAPRFVAEARFIVRKPAALPGDQTIPLTPEQALPGGDQDGYAVQDFILSRDGLQVLLDHGLRRAIARAAGDPLWRFPGPLNGRSNEQLYRYYLWLVDARLEASTGVTTLIVQAFDAREARDMAAALADAGEAMLNRLQDRARQDAVRIATGEVARTRDLATAAEQALTAFRTRESVVDPTMMAQSVLSTITALSLEAVEADAQLDLLRHASAASPQIPPLRSRVAALAAQIDRERAALAGSSASYAPRIAEYERLVLLRDFAVRTFLTALTGLETARREALQQRVYLERVVQPRAADEAAYPHRIRGVLVVLAAGLAVFAIARPRPTE